VSRDPIRTRVRGALDGIFLPPPAGLRSFNRLPGPMFGGFFRRFPAFCGVLWRKPTRRYAGPTGETCGFIPRGSAQSSANCSRSDQNEPAETIPTSHPRCDR
jgi:hypothetical protein